MCGLLGFLTTDGTSDHLVSRIDQAMHCLRHRGPDEHGTWHDEDLVFGFNRLSIIDLEHSHQPLRWGPVENPERYALTFNGEIYNYLEIRAQLTDEFGAQFRTEGDSEAIVAAYHYWGEDAVRRLRGMFAFAVWDTETRELFIARDPFGIKPLFLATGARGTAFGSEKKSLLELADAIGIGTELDPRAVEHYTVLQYVPEPETLHAQIRRLESGCFARVRPGERPAVTRYFRPTFPVRPFAPGTEQQRYREIADALEDSVAKHMRADVTVGSFLSGGIDSTAIAALAMRHNPNLITFTTGFEREGYSEVDVAAESAEAIGARHVVKVVSPAEFAAAIPEIVWYLDDPVADPALVPLWFVAREARKHVKVVLSGEGADELFGGYTIYREPLSLAPFERMPAGLRRLAGKLSDRIPEGTRGKSLLHRGSLSLEERYYGNARSFNDAQLRAVLRDFRPEWTHQDVTASIYAESQGWDPVARMQHLDLFTWLRGDILVKADKMTMANSLELRVPFLDPEVFEVASQVPLEQKITTKRRGGSQPTTKYALRQALEGIVPAHVLHRAKLGFPVPLRHWLQGTELFDWAREQITESGADHLIDKAAVLKMLDEHRAGESDHSRRLWTVLVFMVWHGIFVEKRIVPTIAEPVYPVSL
ncbi:asparagine synthase (glutamine-hydrolyzing) [Rhodococcus triatomae]|uniref:asparagine synthase (glutamine-hydrolyzing) n=1 Tax=Rhodococcus triatomae TaxID=300028 RepID=A0A1G8D6Y9_9NOCA|nr:asparagine synthase (glutamine-hydrolyzing) [Rhodococcus triatomae]QNG18492.1 asparagine synthase (glutamine-hydrolyzing) [Rhodococcus triatomae]QNG21839.1 asparagine synthase (glutamine-hydrolyzing) [Rhodococcus triatomae]SDH53496.1 asparagine synthase (glutamine-hydrolysing) [Rhodococcus triatomae]